MCIWSYSKTGHGFFFFCSFNISSILSMCRVCFLGRSTKSTWEKVRHGEGPPRYAIRNKDKEWVALTWKSILVSNAQKRLLLLQISHIHRDLHQHMHFKKVYFWNVHLESSLLFPTYKPPNISKWSHFLPTPGNSFLISLSLRWYIFVTHIRRLTLVFDPLIQFSPITYSRIWLAMLQQNLYSMSYL